MLKECEHPNIRPCCEFEALAKMTTVIKCLTTNVTEAVNYMVEPQIREELFPILDKMIELLQEKYGEEK